MDRVSRDSWKRPAHLGGLPAQLLADPDLRLEGLHRRRRRRRRLQHADAVAQRDSIVLRQLGLPSAGGGRGSRRISLQRQLCQPLHHRARERGQPTDSTSTTPAYLSSPGTDITRHSLTARARTHSLEDPDLVP
jgi:hypothetical protein